MPVNMSRTALALCALCIAGSGWAQGTSGATGASAAREQQERSTCDGIQQDRAACLREAGAARQEAARNGLTHEGAAPQDANALERCKQLPAADQADCRARVSGSAPGASTSGSVMGGGLLRETVTPVPVPPAK